MQETLKAARISAGYRLLKIVKIRLGIASAILARSETSLIEEGLELVFEKYQIPTRQEA